MSFVTTRPSLPSGYAIPGLPGVERPLHADAAVEVYRLAEASERILLLVPATFEPRAVARARLLAWWEALGPERVVVENPKLTGPPIKDLGFEKKEEEEKQAKEAAAPPPAAK